MDNNVDSNVTLHHINKQLVKIMYGCNIPFNTLDKEAWHKWFQLLFVYYSQTGLMPKLATPFQLTHGIWDCEMNQMKYLVRSVCHAFILLLKHKICMFN